MDEAKKRYEIINRKMNILGSLCLICMVDGVVFHIIGMFIHSPTVGVVAVTFLMLSLIFLLNLFSVISTIGKK